jgi:hypothetical protein
LLRFRLSSLAFVPFWRGRSGAKLVRFATPALLVSATLTARTVLWVRIPPSPPANLVPVAFGSQHPQKSASFAGVFRAGEFLGPVKQSFWGAGECIFLQNLCTSLSGIVLDFVTPSTVSAWSFRISHPQPIAPDYESGGRTFEIVPGAPANPLH